MGRKLYCYNTECKHRNRNNSCMKNKVEIDWDGCKSFEKNFLYYVHLVWELLDHTNMITMPDLTDEVRVGIYYVARLYHLKYKFYNRGSWEFLTLCADEGDAGLNYEQITALKMDYDEFLAIQKEFNENGIPKMNLKSEEDTEKDTKKYKSSQPFGWLSPTGDFIESDWGHHQKSANEIIDNKGFRDEFVSSTFHNTPCDFLCAVKGYCLIHNPSLDGGYIVTNIKPLTKKQKEYLYNYFADMGNTLRAEMYLDE